MRIAESFLRGDSNCQPARRYGLPRLRDYGTDRDSFPIPHSEFPIAATPLSCPSLRRRYGPVLLRRIAHSGHPCPARSTESRRRACHSGDLHARRRLRLFVHLFSNAKPSGHSGQPLEHWLNKKCPHGYRQILATPTCGQIVHVCFRIFELGF